MKINAIKKLVEEYDLTQLQSLVDKLENEQPLDMPVEGEDEGEQLTHLLGAIWIKEQMQLNGTDYKTELRNFTGRVRGSMA